LFEGKKILITGGTGSLGTALTKRLLKTKVKTIRIFSRDEWKQTQMQSELPDSRLRFLIGDIRDKYRINRAMEDIDIVFHTAALKHVPVAEYNPFEFIQTNVIGTQNVIDACFDTGVSLAVAIGTDKASSPVNTYGATKLLMERQFISANFYKGNHKIRFVCVRYGNVLGSRGSIIPKFVEQIKNSRQITITDPNMTRFNITMNEAIELVFRALKYGKGGEIFVPKLKSYRVGDIRDAMIDIFNYKIKVKKIPIRPGEKFHETLINKDEIRNTYETQKDYIINNFAVENLSLPYRKYKFKKTNLHDEYSSNNSEFLSKSELKKIILKHNLTDLDR